MDLKKVAIRVAALSPEDMDPWYVKVRQPLREALKAGTDLESLLHEDFSPEEEGRVKKLVTDFASKYSKFLETAAAGVKLLQKQVGDSLVKSRRASVQADIEVDVDLPFALEGRLLQLVEGEPGEPVPDCPLGVSVSNVQHDYSPAEYDMGHLFSGEGVDVDFDFKVVSLAGQSLSPEESEWLEEKLRASKTWDTVYQLVHDQLAEEYMSRSNEDWHE